MVAVGGLYVIIVSVHVLYIGFISDKMGCQVLQFMFVYIGGQGRGARHYFMIVHELGNCRGLEFLKL